jgi:non-ribosomal peptide synthetase component F
MDLRKETEREAAARETVHKEELTPFDLKRPPLLRINLLQLESRRYILLCNIHHIISDGWSIRVLMEELSLLYNAYSGGKAPAPEPLPVQYKEYAAWQNKRLSRGQLQHSEAYWLQKFAGDIPELDLPLDYPRSEILSHKGASLTFNIGQHVTTALRKFSLEHDVTLFITLLAALEVLLFRVSYQTDIVIGTPTAGRTHKDTGKLIGHFLNTLPVRIRFDKDYTFTRLLKTVRKEVLSAFEHQDYPLDTLVEKLKLKRDYSRGAVFDVMLILNNRMEENNSQQWFTLKGASVKPYEVPIQTCFSSLEFHCNEGNQAIPSFILYNTDMFKPETIEQMGRQWLELLEYLPGSQDTPFKDLQLPCDGNVQQEQVNVERSKTERISMDF